MACDPVSLQNAARCFTCVPDGLKPALNLSLLAKIVGDSRDPQTLEAAASQFALVRGIGMQLAAKAYLLAVINGGSTDPKVLATQVAQYVGYVRDPDGQSNVESYLWALIAGGSTVPANLIPAAVPYDRLRYDTWKVELYLLATKAGITSPQAVVTGASCFFSCLGGGLVRDVIIYLLCTIQNSGFFGTTFGTGIANAWALQVVANGGPLPSQNSIKAAAAFVDTINNAGFWNLMLDINFFAPDSFTAAMTPIKNTDGPALWQGQGGMGAGDLSLNGVTGSSGLGKFIITFADPNARFSGAAPTVFGGFSVYISVNPASANQTEISWIQNNWTLYPDFGGSAFYDAYNTAAGRISVGGTAGVTGFFSGNRLNLASSQLYRGSSGFPFAQVASTGANNTTMPINAGKFIFVLANNNGGNLALQTSNRTVSFAGDHYGLTSAQAQVLFNAVQAIRIAFGGGFV